MVRARSELAHLEEVVEETERDGRSGISHANLGEYLAQVLDGPNTALHAVANETGCLLVPLDEQVVDGVLEGRRNRVVVLGPRVPQLMGT